MTAWVAVAAVSLAIMAIVLVVSAITWFIWWTRLQQNMWGRLEHLVDWMDQEARPTLELARKVLDDAADVSAALKKEAHEFAGTADTIRKGLLRVRDSAEERLQDLDTLLEVVQEEVEDTMLDVASALRTTRRGTRIFRTMKRAFLGRGR